MSEAADWLVQKLPARTARYAAATGRARADLHQSCSRGAHDLLVPTHRSISILTSHEAFRSGLHQLQIVQRETLQSSRKRERSKCAGLHTIHLLVQEPLVAPAYQSQVLSRIALRDSIKCDDRSWPEQAQAASLCGCKGFLSAEHKRFKGCV